MNRFILSALFVIGTGAAMVAQGIEFFHGSWEEALAKAQEENKMMFVDAYATWCGPCKRMAANVFTLEEVGDFFNANFINVKINMEEADGKKFGRKYPVSAYPTFYWIDGNGEVILNTKGARQPADFIALGQTAVDKFDSSAQFRKLYDDGNRDYEVVYGYVTELVKNNNSPVRVANDYLNSQEDLTTNENLAMILAATWQVDSKIYENMVEYKGKIVKEFGQQAFDDAVRRASQNTVTRAIQYNSMDLLADAKKAMSDQLPTEADAFGLRADMDLAVTSNDPESYYNSGKPYVKKYISGDHKALFQVATEVLSNFTKNNDCLDLGVKAAESAVKIKPDKDKYVIVFATLTFVQGNKDAALKILDEAIEKSEEGSSARMQFEGLRKKMESA